MGKSAFDFDDIQALENRRKEVAVLAGASPRAERYRDSPLKKLVREYFKETETKTEEKVRKYAESHPLPGYNFVSSIDPDDEKEISDKATKEAKEAADAQAALMEEANANEYKVTDTSTGLPKAQPVIEDEDVVPVKVVTSAPVAKAPEPKK